MRWRRATGAIAMAAAIVRCSTFGSDDAHGPPDGSLDGAPAPDADGTSADAACDHLFCEDFDDDAGLSRWSPIVVVDPDGGLAYALAGDGLTPPRSFTVTSSNLRYLSKVQLAKVLDPGGAAGDGVVCDVGIFVETGPSNGFVSVAGITIQAPSVAGVGYAALFESRAGGVTTLREDTPVDGGQTTISGPGLTSGQWHTVTLTLSRSTASMVVEVDGLNGIKLPLPHLPPDVGSFAFEIGALSINPFNVPNVPFAARFDSVRCDLR